MNIFHLYHGSETFVTVHESNKFDTIHKVINLTRFMKVINQKAVYGTLDGANTFMLQFFVSKMP